MNKKGKGRPPVEKQETETNRNFKKEKSTSP